MVKKILIHGLAILFSSCISAQNYENKVGLNIKMMTLEGSNYYDKNVVIYLQVYKTAVVPQRRIFGFDDDASGFYMVKLEKKATLVI